MTWNGELKLLMTSSVCQGQGLGSLLVRETLEEMKARGVMDVVLFTDTHCNWRWYEKTGWRRAAEHDWLYKGETITALAYHKTL